MACVYENVFHIVIPIYDNYCAVKLISGSYTNVKILCKKNADLVNSPKQTMLQCHLLHKRHSLSCTDKTDVVKVVTNVN